MGERQAHLCELTRGMLSRVPVVFGGAPARVVEHESAARGARSCRYMLSWDLRWTSRRKARLPRWRRQRGSVEATQVGTDPGGVGHPDSTRQRRLASAASHSRRGRSEMPARIERIVRCRAPIEPRALPLRIVRPSIPITSTRRHRSAVTRRRSSARRTGRSRRAVGPVGLVRPLEPVESVRSAGHPVPRPPVPVSTPRAGSVMTDRPAGGSAPRVRVRPPVRARFRRRRSDRIPTAEQLAEELRAARAALVEAQDSAARWEAAAVAGRGTADERSRAEAEAERSRAEVARLELLLEGSTTSTLELLDHDLDLVVSDLADRADQVLGADRYLLMLRAGQRTAARRPLPGTDRRGGRGGWPPTCGPAARTTRWAPGWWWTSPRRSVATAASPSSSLPDESRPRDRGAGAHAVRPLRGQRPRRVHRAGRRPAQRLDGPDAALLQRAALGPHEPGPGPPDPGRHRPRRDRLRPVDRLPLGPRPLAAGARRLHQPAGRRPTPTSGTIVPQLAALVGHPDPCGTPAGRDRSRPRRPAGRGGQPLDPADDQRPRRARPRRRHRRGSAAGDPHGGGGGPGLGGRSAVRRRRVPRGDRCQLHRRTTAGRPSTTPTSTSACPAWPTRPPRPSRTWSSWRRSPTWPGTTPSPDSPTGASSRTGSSRSSCGPDGWASRCACSSSTSTTSRRSTTPSGTPPVTCSSSRSANAWSRPSAARTPWPGWAATSSPSSCPAWSTSSPSISWPSGRSTPCTRRSRSSASRSPRRRRSGSPSPPSTATATTTSSTGPTRPCTGRRTSAATPSRCSTTPPTPPTPAGGPWTTGSSTTISSPPSTATSSSCSTSPTSTSARRRSWASRP